MNDKFQGSFHDLQVSTNELKIIEVSLRKFKKECEDAGKHTTSIDNLLGRIQSYIEEWNCEA